MRGIPLLLLFAAAVFPAEAQTPSVSNGGVTNGASFAAGQAVTPGSLVSIFGSNLAGALAQASSVPLSTSLGTVQSVTFNNVPAPLVFVSPTQINAQLPWEVASSGNATVVVRTAGGASAPISVPVAPFSPGIFAVNFGTGPAIAINADGSLAAAAGSIPGLATHPARAGDIVLILCTGLGAVDNPATTGARPSTLTRTTTTPVVLVGGVQAQVAFSGLSPEFPGVNQLNVVIPAGAPTGDTVPLQLQVGGVTTTDRVTIAVGP